jgi:bifunctional UDP-N-acetylglucosamine pyrophosphorylase/glucosamine-1-phosphate N-acetyltransferase
MKAVILAAGKGTRLKPMTDKRPKHLLPIGGTPLIEILLKRVREAEIEEVIIVTNYMGDKIKKEIGDGRDLGLSIKFVKQEEMGGTADAFRTIENYIDGDFLGLYGDLYLGSGVLRKISENHIRDETIMASVPVDTPSQYGILDIEDNHVKDLIEKPEPGKEPTNQANGGIYIFPERIFEYINKTGISDRGEFEITDTLKLMMESDEKIRTIKLQENEWKDIGLPWDLLEANKMAMNEVETKIDGRVEKNTTINGQVIISKGAKIRAGTYIDGPVYIGENSDIGPNCYIRPYTYLGPATRVGNACEIKNSIVLKGTHIAHLSYIGDSIIGERCNLGAGTITANLRFDKGNIKVTINEKRMDSGIRKLGMIMGDDCQIGINVSLWPGTMIGSNTWIAPGAIVTRDLPNNTFLKIDQTQVKEELIPRFIN